MSEAGTLSRRRLGMALCAAGFGVATPARGQFSINLGKIADIGRMLRNISIDEDDEIRMGEELFGAIVSSAGGVYRNSAVQNAVAQIAASIFELSERERFAWEIAVVDNNEVNAWALPGGKVGVNKGLLRYVASEDELAAVLAHECGHAELSHAAREMKKKAFYSGLSGAAQTAAVAAIDDAKVSAGVSAVGAPLHSLVTSGYSRESEREADLHIIKVFGATGRNVHAGLGIFRTMLELVPRKSKRTTSLFSGHPQTIKRLEALREAAPADTGEAMPPSAAFATLKTAFPTRQIYMRRNT